MFEIKEKLANTRPPQSREPELVLSPTEGVIKITAPICERIGAENGDHVGIVRGEDGFYLYKGEQGDGNKLASTSGKKVAGTQQFSARNTWDKMGGTMDHTCVFAVAESAEEDENGTEYWALTENGIREKQERGKSVRESQD